MLKSKKNKFNLKNSAELGQRFKMQLDQAKAQFEQMEFESKSEDGGVSVVVTGRREIKHLSIEPEFFSEKREQLESIITAVVNEGLIVVREANKQLTDEVTRKFNEQLGMAAR